MKQLKYILSLLLILFMMGACSEDDKNPIYEKPPVEEEPDMSGFAKGADVSWLTEMEQAGISFYDTAGVKTECLSLLRSMGMNSVRLRVWVNPVDGWCNKTDLLVKAKRAAELNMRIMIDFHYSDSWVDPAQQTKPAVWKDLTGDELVEAIKNHTTEVLKALESWDITPEWVQVGNETGNGMLWDDGLITWDAHFNESCAEYTKLNNAGYDAIKAVFPTTKVVVHLQEGNRLALYTGIFDQLEKNGKKWDVIGMSLYPEADTWQDLNDAVISNINTLSKRYDCEVMLCEIGMNWEEEDASYNFLKDLITRAKAIDQCLGVFYWEPEAYNSWEGYQKGAFNNGGQPTKAMQAFK